MKNIISLWLLLFVGAIFSESLIIAKKSKVAVSKEKRFIKKKRRTKKKRLKKEHSKKRKHLKKKLRRVKKNLGISRLQKRIESRKASKQKINEKLIAWKQKVRKRAVRRPSVLAKTRKRVKLKGRESRKRKIYKGGEAWRERIREKHKALKRKRGMEHEARIELKKREELEFRRIFETGETKISLIQKEYDLLQPGEMQTKFLRFIEKKAKAIEFLFFDQDSDQINALKNILSANVSVPEKIELFKEYRFNLIKDPEFRAKVMSFRLTWHPDRHRSMEAKELATQVFAEINSRIDKFNKVNELPLIPT